MAANMRYARAEQLKVTVPSGRLSGDPVVLGQRPGVCLTDRDTVDGKATVKFVGAFMLPVNGVDQSGNSAVAEGDILYLTEADTIKLSKKNTGVRFGYAFGTLSSGANGTILVVVGY